MAVHVPESAVPAMDVLFDALEGADTSTLTRTDLERITCLGILTAAGVRQDGAVQTLIGKQQEAFLDAWFPETAKTEEAPGDDPS